MKILKKDKGFYTLESMVAIVIFSIGIVGVLNLQSSAISNVTDGLYRTTASSLVENMIGQITLDRMNLATYADGTNIEYENWLKQVNQSLPGVEDNPPTIIVTNEDYGKNVNVIVRWKNPTSSVISNYETNITLY